MRCKDCLPLVEAFFDGTLDGPEAGTVRAHLASCTVCSDALEALQREQETYAAYWRAAGIDAPSWGSVLSAIAEDRATTTSPAPERGRKWAAFARPARLTPAFITAFACIAAAVSLPLLGNLARRSSTPPRAELAAQSGGGDSASSGEVRAGQGTAGAESPADGRAAPRADSAPPRPAHAAKGGVTADGRRAEAGRGKVPPAARLTPPAADGGPAPALPSPGRASDVGGEVAQHFERAQLLFLSLKHTAGAGETIDVSYERGLSRRLLNRNVLLRREAESKGDLPLEELLDSVEPVFAEIAGLPAHASPADVSQIKERIKKTGAVALLKAYSATPVSKAGRESF